MLQTRNKLRMDSKRWQCLLMLSQVQFGNKISHWLTVYLPYCFEAYEVFNIKHYEKYIEVYLESCSLEII